MLSGLEKDDMVSCDESYLTDLTDGDRQYLSSFINNVYLKKESMDDIRQRFVKESSAKLRHFLNDRWMSLVSSAALHQDHGDGVGKGSPALQYDIGTSKEWKAVGPSHKQRFLEFVGVECDSHGQSAGGLMKHIRHRLFTSEPFKRFLAAITNLGKPVGYRSRVRRFRPGYDYTVAHYGVLTTKAVLDATLCFAAGEGKPCRNDEDTGGLIGSGDDAKWESGDFGGFECYIAADDENEDEPDDEYNADDDTELLSVSASNNTLSLVYRDPGTMRFVKYVGHGAPSSRWDLSIEYEMAEQEDNGPESDEESLIGDDE